MTLSHRIPPVITGVATEAHLGYSAPWFTLTSTESIASYQWQIHPLEHGPLRYTLIELPSSGQDSSAIQPKNQHRIRAIYHSIGVGTLMSQAFSEGVLLLPTGKDVDADFEGVVVASLIGLLWKVRGMQTVRVKAPEAEQSTKPKSNKRRSLFRKSWNDVKEDDVIR